LQVVPAIAMAYLPKVLSCWWVERAGARLQLMILAWNARVKYQLADLRSAPAMPRREMDVTRQTVSWD